LPAVAASGQTATGTTPLLLHTHVQPPPPSPPWFMVSKVVRPFPVSHCTHAGTHARRHETPDTRQRHDSGLVVLGASGAASRRLGLLAAGLGLLGEEHGVDLCVVVLCVCVLGGERRGEKGGQCLESRCAASWKKERGKDKNKNKRAHTNERTHARTLGRTPPPAIVTPPRSLLSSSSLRMASCRWRGMMRTFCSCVLVWVWVWVGVRR
jgi:hypothetical protein